MRLGITQYAASSTGKDFLEATAALGLEGVEPYIGDIHDEILSWSDEHIAELAQKERDLGVCIPSTTLAIFNNDPAIVEADSWDKAVDIVERSLQVTARLGAKIMLLCTYIRSHPDTPEKKANLIAVVRAVEPLARDLGVAIALETPLPAEELAEVVDAIGSDCVGVYYDLGNAIYLGYDPAREIGVLGSRIIDMHVKDTVEFLGDAHLGKGKLDLAASVAAMKKVGYDGWLIIETRGDDAAAVRADVQLLRDTWASVSA
jgi:L-ribulose-5-phosphate 3-epimerase